jgi:hypothetical protein
MSPASKKLSARSAGTRSASSPCSRMSTDSHHRADAAAAAEDIGAQVAPLLREAGVGRGAEIFPRRRLAALRANRRFHIFVNAPNESVH